MNNFSYIKRNYDSLLEEISSLSDRLGVAAPTLVCVTKSGDDGELVALAEAGAADIGENRPGEVSRRGEILRGAGFSPRMHEIGTLQRNKIKLIIDSVYMIHSVDSVKLARDINRLAEACGRVIPVLIEVNSAEESQKSGVMPSDAERLLCDISELSNIKVSGLMTMGPATDDGEELRPYFRNTKKLFDKLNSDYGFGNSPTLSMGMSDSWQVAVEEGSSLIRVGRRLFIK
ncbi:MAG: YggS family pyridoxal phosphate-dependent enzyme [Ruminococcaceae bacterium]|nr:YggS family pyridoxal phosphate-dependent enzyme [Oscillospiraceae bacterium]